MEEQMRLMLERQTARLQGPSYSAPQFLMDERIWRRLRWPLFGPLSDIMVMEDGADPQSPLRPLFGISQSHLLASELATEPPRMRMLVDCSIVSCYEAGTSEPIPEPLIIESSGGGPLTIGDIVKKLHPYLSEMETVIREVFNSIAQFFFSGFGGKSCTEPYDPNDVFQVYVKEDEGDMDEHWVSNSKIVKAQQRRWPPNPNGAGNVGDVRTSIIN
ncbi:hypothetical protein B0J14DRAFT_595060 [Halenospora varia]|nr:hypothetical protein B0J14DRAFT_595060 [Halenospora varia]